MSLKLFIQKIVANEQSHARWLNTLSFLEHIGSRKIIKSQHSPDLNLHLLQHIAEEARHAYFMKRICQRHFPNRCPDFQPHHLLGGDAAENYFQGLDRRVEQSLQDIPGNTLNYLYVTWLIEERAMEVYSVYQSVLAENLLAINLKPILAEEEAHLQETLAALGKNDPEFPARSISFKQIEADLFTTFLHLMESSL